LTWPREVQTQLTFLPAPPRAFATPPRDPHHLRSSPRDTRLKDKKEHFEAGTSEECRYVSGRRRRRRRNKSFIESPTWRASTPPPSDGCFGARWPGPGPGGGGGGIEGAHKITHPFRWRGNAANAANVATKRSSVPGTPSSRPAKSYRRLLDGASFFKFKHAFALPNSLYPASSLNASLITHRVISLPKHSFI
jgi:hypothetical protein